MTKWDYDGPILEIDKLSISFFTRLREIPAVMDFSATVMPGEALGLALALARHQLLDRHGEGTAPPVVLDQPAEDRATLRLIEPGIIVDAGLRDDLGNCIGMNG